MLFSGRIYIGERGRMNVEQAHCDTTKRAHLHAFQRFLVGVDEVVHDGHVKAGLQEAQDGVRANVAGTTRDQDLRVARRWHRWDRWQWGCGRRDDGGHEGTGEGRKE